METETKKPTCEERIDSHMKSRLDDLRTMMQPDASMVELIDDGTLDTVICIGDEEFRYDVETAAEWRDSDGSFDVDLFVSDRAWDQVCETLWERFGEYGLSWDYVEADSENGDPGYFRYQISWGGPSDEFRFFVDYGGQLYCVEYWFLDWFDGASRTLHGDDYQLLEQIFDWFADIGACDRP